MRTGGSYAADKASGGVKPITAVHLLPRLKMNWAVPRLPQCVHRVKFTSHYFSKSEGLRVWECGVLLCRGSVSTLVTRVPLILFISLPLHQQMGHGRSSKTQGSLCTARRKWQEVGSYLIKWAYDENAESTKQIHSWKADFRSFRHNTSPSCMKPEFLLTYEYS